MRTRQVEHDGRAHTGVPVEIDQVWGKYTELRLDDGSVLRVRYDVARVTRLVDVSQPDGEPVYVVEGSPVVSVIPPKGGQT